MKVRTFKRNIYVTIIFTLLVILGLIYSSQVHDLSFEFTLLGMFTLGYFWIGVIFPIYFSGLNDNGPQFQADYYCKHWFFKHFLLEEEDKPQ